MPIRSRWSLHILAVALAWCAAPTPACRRNDAEERPKRRSEQEAQARTEKLLTRAKLKEQVFGGTLEPLLFRGRSAEPLRYTITLAEGFEALENYDKTAARYGFIPTDDREPKGPEIKIVSRDPAEPWEKPNIPSESALHREHVFNILKQEYTSTGWIISQQSNTTLDVEVVVSTREAWLQCTAHLDSPEASKVKDELIPWMEKMCLSLQHQ